MFKTPRGSVLRGHGHRLSPVAARVQRRLLAVATALAVLLGVCVVTTEPVAADVVGTLSIIAGTGQEGAATAGPATASKLNYPHSMAVDASGNVYIADSMNHVVERVAPDGTLSIFAGTGVWGAPTAGPATSSRLDQPMDVAVDSSGNVYVADPGNNMIVKVTSDGTLSIIAGNGSQNQPTPGPATSSALYHPNGVAVDSSGNVYIADTGNNRIEKVTPDGTLSIFAGSAPAFPPRPPWDPRPFTPGTATDVNLNSPKDVAVDSSGDVYIADTDNMRVEKVTGGVLSVVAGDGSWGAPTAGTATSSPLNQPWSVAVDATGTLFIADWSANVVAKVGASGVLSIIAGTGAYGSPTEGPATSSRLGGPRGVAVDSIGNVYIANTFNYRILKVSFPAPPAAPTSLVATPGDGSASIAFTAGADGGAAISKVQYRVGSGAWTDAEGTTSPITVSGLTNLVASRIRLRAVNSVGSGAGSTAVTVTPRPAGPSIVSATPSGRTGFVVTFSLNPLPGTTVAYQSVRVYARGSSAVLGTCRTFAARTTCFVGGLTRGTDYDLRATAHVPVVGKTWHNTTLEGATLQVRTNG